MNDKVMVIFVIMVRSDKHYHAEVLHYIENLSEVGNILKTSLH